MKIRGMVTMDDEAGPDCPALLPGMHPEAERMVEPSFRSEDWQSIRRCLLPKIDVISTPSGR